MNRRILLAIISGIALGLIVSSIGYSFLQHPEVSANCGCTTTTQSYTLVGNGQMNVTALSLLIGITYQPPWIGQIQVYNIQNITVTITNSSTGWTYYQLHVFGNIAAPVLNYAVTSFSYAYNSSAPVTSARFS